MKQKNLPVTVIDDITELREGDLVIYDDGIGIVKTRGHTLLHKHLFVKITKLEYGAGLYNDKISKETIKYYNNGNSYIDFLKIELEEEK